MSESININYFTDKSIFDGVWEFSTPNGEEIKLEWQGSGILSVYYLQGKSWIFDKKVKFKYKSNVAHISENLKSIYDNLINGEKDN